MQRRAVLKGALASTALVSGCATFSRGRSDLSHDALQKAFNYAFPLYEFARIQQERTGAIDGLPGRLNTLMHRSQLADQTARQVTAPNNDTIYSSAFLELSGGPIEIQAPSSADRYYSIAFMQAFTDVFAYIGTRATRGQGGSYWIVGPAWDGALPADANIIRSPTNDVWMLMRTLVAGPRDLEAARAFQQGLTIAASPSRAPARGYVNAASDVNDPANFLLVVNEVMSRSSGGGGILARAPLFEVQGITSPHTPSQDIVDAYRQFIPEGLAHLREVFRFGGLNAGGWSYQPHGIGDFGDNDELRAAVALGGIAALTEEEAMYFQGNFDAEGAPLDGGRTYRWRLPAGGVPTDAFWSLTMYTVTPEGRFFLVENPINRFSIGDRTPGLVVADDGSLDIIIQRTQPGDGLAANWLPSPAGTVRLSLRAYLPRAELCNRTWQVPPLVRSAPL